MARYTASTSGIHSPRVKQEFSDNIEEPISNPWEEDARREGQRWLLYRVRKRRFLKITKTRIVASGSYVVLAEKRARRIGPNFLERINPDTEEVVSFIAPSVK